MGIQASISVAVPEQITAITQDKGRVFFKASGFAPALSPEFSINFYLSPLL
jgi:hypothetical protein